MPLIADENNGGSQIISYNLQIDDAERGEFVSVGGFDPISMTTEYRLTNVLRGKTYRLRYRVKNDVTGDSWSPYSPTLYALVADTPSPPKSPKLIVASSNSITLQLFESEDSGGSRI